MKFIQLDHIDTQEPISKILYTDNYVGPIVPYYAYVFNKEF